VPAPLVDSFHTVVYGSVEFIKLFTIYAYKTEVIGT